MLKSYTAKGIRDLDLTHTFECGQCFRWEKQPDGSYTGVAKGRIVNMRLDSAGAGAQGMDLTVTPCTKSEFDGIWAPYLDLDRDYGKIKEDLIAADRDTGVMERATEYGYGIRILDQDLWETIVSFIISQNNNIPRIKGCIGRLAENFGDEIRLTEECGQLAENLGGGNRLPEECGSASGDRQVELPGGALLPCRAFDIPSPEKLVSLTVDDLAPVRLGYRAKYLIETAKCVVKSGLPGTFDELSSLCGVGPKVANCISLFGMKGYSSFPIDVWVIKVMHELYGLDEGDKKAMADFASDKFGELGGFAQQYLFYYMRSGGEIQKTVDH